MSARRLAAAALPMLAACSAGTKPAAPAPTLPAVAVGYVSRAAIAGGYSVSGAIVAREEAALGAELPGYRVLAVLAQEGDTVRRGQPLALLDPALVEGELRRAAVAAERARTEYARVADLSGKGVVADETIAQRGFEARAAAAQLGELRTRRARLVLRAPVAGLVVARALRPGDISAAGGEPYFRLARGGLFELDAQVPEAALDRVRVGAAVPVTLASGTRLIGRVRLVGRSIDAGSRLGHVRVLLPRDPRTRLGGFAAAKIGDEGVAGPAIPERALVYDAGGASVLIVDAGDRVRRVAVRAGRHGGGLVALAEGPRVGTRVVLAGGRQLLPGDRVRPVTEPLP